MLEVLREPMLALLLGAGVVYLALGSLQDAVILLAFASLSVVITVVQESRTEHVLEALSSLTSPRALVIRDGARLRIAGREVVRGDLVVLSEGDRVPADAFLLECHDLQADESLLTGESVPVRKAAAEAGAPPGPLRPGGDGLPAVFSGSLVVRGTGIAEVTAIGARSEIGRIGQSLGTVETETPRLRRETGRLVRIFGLAGLAVSALAVILYGTLRGGWLDALLGGIALGMSMLPEEFPVVLTVFMAMGAWRISRARVLTRRAAAIETLGSATVLCTDKTGTLTQNRMSIAELRVPGADPFRPEPAATIPDAFQDLVQHGLLASEANPFDPMERAFHDLGQPLSRHWTLAHAWGIEPGLLAMSQAWQPGDGRTELVVATKGAPEAVAELCRLGPGESAALRESVDAMAADGLRILGVARAAIGGGIEPGERRALAHHFLGLVGLADPLRPGVSAAVGECRTAGIRVVMITGDYPATAQAIARQAGLEAGEVVTGPELEQMSEAELARRVRTATVFARIMPEQKLRIVTALKAAGEVVAMTGDGVNDAPSLKAAHIGIAMGGRGTDVAREASAMVLLDDDFGSIVTTIRLGRRIYDNLRKAMGFILAVHVPIAGMALLPLLLGLPVLFGPVHIAFLEMVIDPVCSLVFEAERAEEDVMQRPPRAPDAPLFGMGLIAWSLLQGTVALALVGFIYLAASGRGMPEDEIRALTFFSLVLAIVSLILVNRNFSASPAAAFRRPSLSLVLVLLGVTAMLAGSLLWPFASGLFRFGPLHGHDMAVTMGAGVAVLVVLDALKLVVRRVGGSIRAAGVAAILLAVLGCRASPPGGMPPDDVDAGQRGLLPVGRRLDPAGPVFDIGQFPLAMLPAPGGRQVVLLLSGYRDQGVQVVDRATGAVVQTLLQQAGFVGLVFAPDGRTLYASGGDRDLVYRYEWREGRARLRDSIPLAVRPDSSRSGTRYPAGLGVSPDGRTLYAAENLADSVAVIDVATGEVSQRLPAGRYPYGVAVGPDGTVYVSAWGGNEVRSYRPDGTGWLQPPRTIPVARHPSTLLLNAAATRLFVTSGSTDRVSVVDTRTGRVITELLDPGPAGPAEGSTPNALALSADGTRLFVAEADNNAVAVFDLAGATAGTAAARGEDRLAGRIPAGWYPTALLASGDTLLVANAKGRGAGPNPDTGPTPLRARKPGGYTLDQIGSTLMVSTAARADSAALRPLTARVARANGWDVERGPFRYPPIEHVVYIIKENRTYDQVLGDLRQADGDTALLFFPRPVSPNHHALAERFGIFDRFFVNAEVSPDGHNWSMAAYSTDYLQKTVPSNYGDRGRSYDYEGTNRGVRPAPGEDAAEPASGYLWNMAQAGGISFRNFGEFVMPEDADERGPAPRGYRGLKPFLEAHTDSAFPGYNLRIPDQRRADVWLRALAGWVAAGQMPRLQIIRLPNDHTMGARAGELSPRAYMADNDLALGRMIEALSRSPFWGSTAVFVLEDDAQNGPDHVDSHRSVLLVISPWSRGGVLHRWTNTTDVIATMEEILGLGRLSQFDYYGRPLREIWRSTPDLAPYAALTPAQSLTERNPRSGGPGSGEAAGLDFRFEDVAEEGAFNRSLWFNLKGPGVPYPGTRRMAGQPLR